MANGAKLSLIWPVERDKMNQLQETVIHDLGLDVICEKVAAKPQEQGILLNVLSAMTDDPAVTQYRLEVFRDIYEHPDMCEKLMKLLDKIDFLRDYGSFKDRYDEHAGVWDLMHRLEEIRDYINYVEAIYECLRDTELKSEGLGRLKTYVDTLYHERGFAELKKDIEECRATTASLRSVTVGINLNERFEAAGIGLISINSKPFAKSGILSNLSDAIIKNNIRPDNDWDENYKFHPFAASDALGAVERFAERRMRMNPMYTIASVPKDDSAEGVTYHMEKVTNHLLAVVIKKLKEVLKRYVYVTITDITDLIPELVYYIRFAEYTRGLKDKGYMFCMPEVIRNSADAREAIAKGLWNLKLAAGCAADEIVRNDLDFDENHRVYILTGANRGGKTTVTQAVGQLFVLAQGGIFVPAESFRFCPADRVCTHFPADEDKTLDLGRLGEECQRFRDMFRDCGKSSLLLLNETFSTTSFEEGYYIARDSVRAILKSGIRTVYNTHMHKLAFELDDINSGEADGKAVSLIVRSEEGKRSFRVCVAPPEGMSYARDIAEKYGVTYEMLTGKGNG